MFQIPLLLLHQIIFVLYALVFAIAGALLTITWLHATKNKLIDKDLSPREIHNISLEVVVPTVEKRIVEPRICFLLSAAATTAWYFTKYQ
jgi:hypothetical protein